MKTAQQEAVYGGAAGSWYDPCYHRLCDNLMTVLTGVPPLDAEGLAPEGDEAAKLAAQAKMAGGAIKSLKELSGAASYAVYYFGTSKDPFGTKPHKKTKSQLRARMAGPRTPSTARRSFTGRRPLLGAAPTTPRLSRSPYRRSTQSCVTQSRPPTAASSDSCCAKTPSARRLAPQTHSEFVKGIM